MHRHQSYVKKTRGGKVMKVLYVLDTNVVLHQLDLLESRHNLFEYLNLIFLQTVVDEVLHNDQRLHQRLRTLIDTHAHAYVFSNEHHRETYVERMENETPNDRNDRAIRTATKWYQQHWTRETEIVPVVLMTQDRANRDKAIAENLTSLSITEFVSAHAQTHPALIQLLAQIRLEEKDSTAAKSSSFTYPAHLSLTEAQRGIDIGKLKRGTFKVNRDFWAEATVQVKGLSHPVFIPDFLSMNRAIDGDVVAVDILPQSQWKKPNHGVTPAIDEPEHVTISADIHSDNSTGMEQAAAATTKTASSSASSAAVLPTGRVVCVLQRNWRACCGSFELSSKSRGSLLFLCVNRRIPRIRVNTNQADVLMNKRIKVQIDSWPQDSRYPLGHYTATIGDIGDKDTETAVLLMEHDVPTAAWSNAVLSCLPADTHHIDPAHIPGRLDLRHLNIFSIDPPGCTDIDDALHVRMLPNGNYEVGVHIADVSHYVQSDTALDAEAAHRGTSVYLVDRRIDMLPSLLSTNLCSLKANIDRLTFSVLWELTPSAQVISTTFNRAVIRSVASFTYAQAQAHLDTNDTHNPITLACKQLNALAKTLKQQRIDAGALMLASAEVKFLLDAESQQPTDVEMYQLKEANSLVEEFMLLANISVAKRIVTHFPTFALLRRHPVPPQDHFLPLKHAARVVGIEIRTETSKALAESLDAAVIEGYPFFNKLLRILATRCMTQALYFSSGDVNPQEYYHYGLAARVYTHFTSPIRRYADIVVHRLLAASLGMMALPAAVEDRERVRAMADTINHRHRMAQLVSRASAELYTLIFFAEKKPANGAMPAAASSTGDQKEEKDERKQTRIVGAVVTESAIIISMRATGVRVMIPRYGIEGAITLFKPAKAIDGETEGDEEDNSAASKQSNPYIYDDVSMTLTGPRGTFRIFEQVLVDICVKERQRRRWLNIELKDKANMISQPTEALLRHRQNLPNTKQSAAIEQKGIMVDGDTLDDAFVVEDEMDVDDAHDSSSVKKRKVFHSA